MYDALRRAEGERKRAMHGRKENSSAGSKGAMSAKNKIVLLLVAAVVVLGAAVYRFNTTKTSSGKVSPVAMQTVPVAAPAAPVTAATTMTKKRQRAPGTYQLDGIINGGGRSMAVINGRILIIEQSLDHLILTKISPQQVELLNTNDQSTVILKLK